jgi:UDP-GlcNAc:undecaprenyl-phosphate/decaprenyl-phosphate GlcNAc-1-phosphate transferase
LPDEVRLVGAGLVSLLLVWALAPLAIRLAAKTAFFDHPVGYKAHAAPTPYLGGVAVLWGFVLAAVVFGEGNTRFWPVLIGIAALAALGVLDDRIAVRPRYRVLAELAAATLLWATNLGWTFIDGELEELVLTCLWVLGVTNALNLMDNMDGAAATVGAACSAGIAALALVEGDPVLGAFALSLAGACVGFLRFNLRRGAPARIFLGDGGSMPIGFLVAAMAMNLPVGDGLGWPLLLVGGLLLGVPVLDTVLVIVSRTRRGVALMTGGRDHLTHRLHTKLSSAHTVALVLAVLQAAVSLLAIVALQLGREAIIMAALVCLALAAGVIALLEKPAWTHDHRRGDPSAHRVEPAEPAWTHSHRAGNPAAYRVEPAEALVSARE